MASELEDQIIYRSGPFPSHQKCSEADYYLLESSGYVELVNGWLEFPPLPTLLHQSIVVWLVTQLKSWNKVANAGIAAILPLPLKLFDGTIREPDILFIPKPETPLLPPYPSSAVLVMEVVSEGEESRHRDYIAKRADYAKAAIPEYWIVDPIEKAVTVLKLEGAEYTLHGRFEKDAIATSATLPGFSIACGQIWTLENQS